MYQNKTFLITGGTGSFGHAVVKRLLNEGAWKIRILSRDEKKQDDMRREFASNRLAFYLGDVRDQRSLVDAITGADYVFHAAAMKQVPSCEFFPSEALRTNTLGTENVVEAAITAKVKCLVLLSTDKAAYPINAMGISKALAERIVSAKSRLAQRSGTVLCTTRYGNVMGSRGSVIPLFVGQAKNSLPLTVTDPTMTRFMMSLEEAVDLVLYAFRNASPGDLFVQKAPAATIETVAAAVSRLFGVRKPPQVIGTRHGEKQHETLVTREEASRAEDLGAYYRIKSDTRDLNYSLFFSEGATAGVNPLGYCSDTAYCLTLEETIDLLDRQPFIQEELAGWTAPKEEETEETEHHVDAALKQTCRRFGIDCRL